MRRVIKYIVLFAVFLTPSCYTALQEKMIKEFGVVNEQLYAIQKKQDEQVERIKALEGGLQEDSAGQKGKKEDAQKAPASPGLSAEDFQDIPEPVIAAYKNAYELYREGRYQKAITAFLQFLEEGSDHPLRDNAMYWLGECYNSLKNTKRAIFYFESVYRNYPFGNKAAHALYKIAILFEEAGEISKGLLAIRKIKQEYPDSDIYDKALQREKILVSKSRR